LACAARQRFAAHTFDNIECWQHDALLPQYFNLRFSKDDASVGLLGQIGEMVNGAAIVRNRDRCSMNIPARRRSASGRARTILGVLLLLVGSVITISVVAHFTSQKNSHEILNQTDLFAMSLSCPTTHHWVVDFDGNGTPYQIEEHHCSKGQLLVFNFAKDLKIDRDSSYGYNFLLVTKPRLFLPDKIVHGEVREGEYTVVLLTDIPSGKRQEALIDVDTVQHPLPTLIHYCLLAWSERAGISCWTFGSEFGTDPISQYLEPGESDRIPERYAGIEVLNNRLYLQNPVWATDDPECCPSHSDFIAEIIPKDGKLTWGYVARANVRSRSERHNIEWALQSLSIFGFAPWESPERATSNALALLGPASIAKGCQSRSAGSAVFPDYVDCLFIGNSSELVKTTLLSGHLQQIEYHFPISRYASVRHEIEDAIGPSNEETNNLPEDGIANWGGVSQPFDVSLIKVVDGINAVVEVNLNKEHWDQRSAD